ncbi:hypothetical protein ABNQ39_35980 (plasmid) [Azospirillum sp. A26]|uniref:nSTAND1 domain-containing NTPase n=1 Tax=Azospirillum sp. A26 TaxID=3160607 RepID=UPI00366C3014
MSAPLHDCVIRFWRDTGTGRTIAGTGFLVAGTDGQTYALTCAHVANLAFGRSVAEDRSPRDGSVSVDLVGRGAALTLDLVEWRPPAPLREARTSAVADIAVFTVRPPFAAPFRPPLRIEPPSRVVPPGGRVPFHSFGFMGTQNGVATQGVLTAVDAGGWFVADGDERFQRFIEEGLSGAPIFADGRVLGLVVQRLERDARQGLVIPALALAHAWPPLASPYPGLPAFDAGTAHLFFGRGRASAPDVEPCGTLKAVLDRLRSQRLLALMGASGSGKSSLAKAGVADFYRRQGWAVLTLRPGLTPLRNLAEAIASEVEGLGPGPERLMAMDRWELALEADRLTEALALAQGKGAAGVLLVVDQFEEFFPGREEQGANRVGEPLATVEAAGIARQRARLLPQLRRVVERGEAHCLLTARLDLIEGMVSGDAEAARLLKDPYPIFVLTRMAAREVREAIEGPAALFGVATDAGFATDLAAAATQGEGRLPLLQETLRQCWAGLQRGPDGWWLRPPRAADGGEPAQLLEESLARRGDQALAAMGADPVDVQRVLLALVRLVAGRPVRRLLPLAEVAAADRALLDRLADERLVVIDGERDTAELVHEAVMVRWPLLAGWIDEQRAFLGWRDRFERDFITWRDGGREAKDALRPHDLAQALDWERSPGRVRGCPTPEQTAFVRASHAVHEAENRRKAEQLRRIRKWLRVAIVALGLMVLAIGAGGFAFKLALDQTKRSEEEASRADEQAKHAQQQTKLAQEKTEAAQRQESRALAILAQQESAKGDQGTAMLLALEALPEPAFGGNRPVSPEAAAALHQALMRNKETALIGHQAGVSVVAFSPNGRYVVTASFDKTARLWDLSGSTPTATVLEGHASGVLAAAFSPDGGHLVTASSDSTARLWNLSGSTPTATVLAGHTDRVWAAAFSPDGGHLVTTSSDRTARLWNLSGFTPAFTVLEGHTDVVKAVAFSPDGHRLVTASFDETARLWDLSGPMPTATVLKGHTGGLLAAAFSPNGHHLVTASFDKTARLWNLSGSTPTSTVLKGHTDHVLAAAFSPDGRHLATGSADNTARLWDLSGSTPTATVLQGHTERVVAVAFSPDGHRLVTASVDNTARLWGLSGRPPTATVLEHSDMVRAAAFSPDGRRLVTASSDRTARLWDLSGGLPTATVLEGHANQVLAAAFSPDGRRLVVGSDNRTVRLWDLSGATPTSTPLKGHTGSVTVAAFSLDAHRLVTASFDDTVWLWDLSEASPTATPLKGHTGSVRTAAFSPDGRHLVIGGSSDKAARLWDLTGATPTVTVLEGHTGRVEAAAFSPDGRRLITASTDKTARLWDLSGDPPTATVLQGHTDQVLAAAFSADGRRVVTGSWDNTARIWEMTGAKPTATVLEGHTDTVRAVAFSPDGRRLVTASNDKTVRLWDLSGITPVATVFEGHTDRVLTAAFDPDGRHVVTASLDKTARAWGVYPDTNELSALVRSRLTRCLSIAQRERFGLAVEDRTRPRDFIPAPDTQGLCPH